MAVNGFARSSPGKHFAATVSKVAWGLRDRYISHFALIAPRLSRTELPLSHPRIKRHLPRKRSQSFPIRASSGWQEILVVMSLFSVASLKRSAMSDFSFPNHPKYGGSLRAR